MKYVQLIESTLLHFGFSDSQRARAALQFPLVRPWPWLRDLPTAWWLTYPLKDCLVVNG